MAEILGIDQRELYTKHITVPTLARKSALARKYTSKIAAFVVKWLSDPGEITREDIRELLRGVFFYSQCYEGMWFMGGFAPIFALCERNLMSGSAVQLLYIWRDENLHVDGWTEWFQTVQQETGVTLPVECMLDIVLEALAAEVEYAREEYPTILGYNPNVNEAWMKHLATLRLNNLGVSTTGVKFLEGAAAPPWIGRWQTKREGNFFETRVIDYQVGALKWDE
jgi:ribonucleotide reductase beta subunit family protein with ferritin-like domain